MSFPILSSRAALGLAAAIGAFALPFGASAQQAAASAEPPAAWLKICNTNPQNNQEACILTQELRAETGAPIASMSIQMGVEPGKYGIGVMVPLGFILPPGITLSIDGQKAGQAQFAICVPQSQQQPSACVARALVDDKFIAALKKGNKLSLVLTSPQNKPIPIELTLAGFSKAFDGPGLDRAAAEAQRQQLSEALQKSAQEARQKLIEQQQKEIGNAPN